MDKMLKSEGSSSVGCVLIFSQWPLIIIEREGVCLTGVLGVFSILLVFVCACCLDFCTIFFPIVEIIVELATSWFLPYMTINLNLLMGLNY